MHMEGQTLDKKSLRTITIKPDWKEIAKDCVAFANAQGGKLLIGIEDDADLPPNEQRVPLKAVEALRKNVAEKTVNVTILPAIMTADNGGEYLKVDILRSLSVASTTDGRYFIRVADSSKPVVGDDVMRLAGERAAMPWETITTLRIPYTQLDIEKGRKFCDAIRHSDRVNASVKEKTDAEILEHYYLTSGPLLTNLGILCVGRREDRARLGTAPVIQFLKFDADGKKIAKRVWDEYDRSPMELVEAIWLDVPDWQTSEELPDGLFRQSIPHYAEAVVRELLINALVHRPYTQGGDIFINLYPERLEIVNPGRLPMGVTPGNILHASIRRNEHLAKVFHDLKMMEREGSGYDTVYESLLSQGKPLPEMREGPDSFMVTVRRRIFNPKIIDFVAKADQTYQLGQREKICLGLLAQHETLTATGLCRLLELPAADALKPWLERLVTLGIVQSRGKTKGTTYRVAVQTVRSLALSVPTTLKDIESHRLRELVITDLRKYGDAGIGEIQQRIGQDIPRRQLQWTLTNLIKEGVVDKTGSYRHTRYRLRDIL